MTQPDPVSSPTAQPRAEPVPQRDGESLPPAMRLTDEFLHTIETLTPRPYVTYTMVALNAAVYLLVARKHGFTGIPADVIRNCGGNYGPLTVTAGQWWRLAVSAFLHFNLVHLGLNLLVLMQVGPFVERLVGNVGFLIAYCFAALAGSLMSICWTTSIAGGVFSPLVVSAGASGAVFGAFGVLLGYLIRGRRFIPRRLLSRVFEMAMFLVVANVLLGTMSTGVDLGAHLGGLIGGLAYGMVLSQPIVPGIVARRRKRNAVALLACAAMVLVAARLLPRPVDFAGEFRTLYDLNRNLNEQSDALYAEYLKDRAKPEAYVKALQDQILPDWRRALARFDRMPVLKGDREWYRDKVRTYMTYRQRQWEYTIRWLRDPHDASKLNAAQDWLNAANDAMDVFELWNQRALPSKLPRPPANR